MRIEERSGRQQEMRHITESVAFILAVLVMFGLFSAGVSYAEIDPSTIVGLWLFDDDEEDIAIDSSGNGNDGTFVGKPKFIAGKFGKALEFDGASYVNIPDSNSLDMDDQITIMFWVRSDKVMVDMWNDRQVVVSKSAREYDIGIYMTGQLHTYTSDGAGSYDEGIMTTIAGKLPDEDPDWEEGKWYHVAWTLDERHEIAYVNGINIGEYDKANEGTIAGTNPVNIGQRTDGSLKLTGAVDEVIILKDVLEIDDIEVAANEGLEAALGIKAVSAVGKLATTWSSVKAQ